VVVTGNIKLAQLPKVTRRLVKPEGLVVCAASTHQGEETLILEAFAALKAQEPEAKLIVVPRHPERFEKVCEEVEVFAAEHGLTWHRFSVDKSLNTDITVVDRLGELVNVYAVSDVVILGGAFEPIGGHNAAEAAQFGCKIISGPHYFNQKDIFDAVEGIAVVEASNLARRLQQHGVLKPAKVRTKADIMPIVESLNDVL
jgi:3-deoxy-D-manno-octulosonic-acid transferase